MAAVGAREHQRFCQIDGWVELKSARGQGRDHIFYVKELIDGTVLRTKVSHGTKGKEAYSRGLWVHILKEQLSLASEDEFWAVLNERRPAERTTVEVQEEEIPVWLAQQLIYTAKLKPEELAEMSLADAEARWAEFTMRPAVSADGAPPSQEPTPEWMVAQLVSGLDLPADEVRALSRREAEELWRELGTPPPVSDHGDAPQPPRSPQRPNLEPGLGWS